MRFSALSASQFPDQTLERLDAVADLATVLMVSYRKQTAYALEPDGADRMEALEEAVQRLRAYTEAQAALSCAYDPTAWRKLDGDEIAQALAGSRGDVVAEKLFCPPPPDQRRLKVGGAQGMPDPVRDAPTLKRLRVEGEAIDRLEGQLSGFKVWKGHTTDPEAALALKTVGAARAACGRKVSRRCIGAGGS